MAGRPGMSGSPHGVGITNDALHEYRLRFLRQVNEGLQQMWDANERMPLVLAGVEEVIHEFRGLFNYPGTVLD
ncbi:hypothetical protein, partial [Acinetobacter baumannii]|uniref:baeRF3 domain-containing protein n=1 Tax=Acinetobacter baumannii TaxID=470 RepID=UPI003D6AD94E